MLASIKVLEIKTSILFHLDFGNSTISPFFFFFLMNDVCSLIPEVIAQIFNLIAELLIPKEIPTNKK